MLKSTLFILLLTITWGAVAGSNLLDLLKAGRASYSTHSCQTFIQAANHQTLVSDDLKKLVIPAQNSRFVDDYYFHYTNASILMQTLKSSNPDRVAAQAEIVRDGGYKSIIQYQMTYADALSNIAGVGFYVSANPFSSQSYGAQQVALRVSPKANFFDLAQHRAAYQAILAKTIAQYPAFGRCDGDLQFSLLMNENDIDLVLYDADNEWLVVFNEDIFTESRITYVGPASHTEIVNKLIATGDGSAVIEYVHDLGLNKKYGKITLAEFFKQLPAAAAADGKNLIVKLAESLKANWSDSLRQIFARLVSTRSGIELHGLMSDLSSSGLVPQQTYLTIPFTGASSDFLNWLSARVRLSPGDAKNWRQNYRDNILELFKKDLIDLNFVFANAPVEFDAAKFYKDYSTLGLPKEKVIALLNHMFENSPSLFTSLDSEARYAVFNDFMKHAAPSDISGFTDTMDKLGYDNLSSYNYITRRSSLFGPNGLAFMISFIKLKKDPKLLTDPVIALVVASKEMNPSFMLYLKQNRALFGTQADSYTSKYLASVPVGEMDGLFSPAVVSALSNSEQASILERILTTETAVAAAMLPKAVQAFSYSMDALAQLISGTVANLPGIEALRLIQSDPSVWTKFKDIKNPNGILPLLKLGSSHVRLQAYVIDVATDSLLSSPDALPVLSPVSMSYLLRASRLRPYFSSYTETQKLEMAKKVRQFNRNESKEFMAAITYDRALVQANLSSLLASTEASDLEDLLNNPSFVKELSAAEFLRLVKAITVFDAEINLKTLLRSDALTFEKAMILGLSLESHHGRDHLEELMGHQLKFDDLQESQKSALLSKYTKEFNSISALARAKLWAKLFIYADATKRELFVSGFDRMSSSQKINLLNHFATTPGLIQKGIDLFKLQSKSFIKETLSVDHVPTITLVLKFIEENYPVKEDYALHMIYLYDASRLASAAIQLNHLQNFVCKKVNKWYAFDEILDNTKDKDVKKDLKDRRKIICR